MVSLCLDDVSGRMLLLAPPRLAVAALLGPTHFGASLSHLRLDSMRPRVGPRGYMFRAPVQPNDVRRLFRCGIIRPVRDRRTLLGITAIAFSRGSSQDQAGTQSPAHHGGHRQLDLPSHQPLMLSNPF
jgi:hypothetical protein